MIYNKVLSSDELRDAYGEFFSHSRKIEFDKSSVPTNLLPLVPYAEFWGETDDGYRDDLIVKVPEDVLRNLKYAVKEFDDELDYWLAGPEALSRTPSDAYLAYSAMRIASDFIRRHQS